MLDRGVDAHAALLAASRGGEPRAAEMARELLPDRYPYVPEFRSALELDSANAELRRELAYLLLRMDLQKEAEEEFRVLTGIAPTDLLSATQLAFLLHARGQDVEAKPLFDRVLAGADEDLANRVRAVLQLPQVLKNRAEAPPASIDAKVMAERSIKAGYMKDALQYLTVAHEIDPGDFDVMLKLGWTYNALRQDLLAIRWFDLARKSTDPHIAAEAGRAWHNLHGATERFRISAWVFPVFSTRWHDLFSYGQVKTEVRTSLPVTPYVSARFVGDTRLTIGAVSPQDLSESSVIVAMGLATKTWHGITGWAEAGWSISYVKGSMLPDYRGGVSIARGVGHSLRGETPGWFADTTVDALYVSRFNHDSLVYTQSRAGYTAGPQSLRGQLYWNANLTFDQKREYWANFVETGPGVRLGGAFLPQSMYLTFNLLRGAYLINTDNPRRPNFNDFRAGFWYAFTH
jgi:tetratricopeptide (TPR) repeat protein